MILFYVQLFTYNMCMSHAKLTREVENECIQLYQDSIADGLNDTACVKIIGEFLNKNGIQMADRTVWNKIAVWRRSFSLSEIVQQSDVNLDREKFILEDVIESLHGRWKKIDERTKPDSYSKELSFVLGDLKLFVEMASKIKVLESSKKTLIREGSDQGRIVLTNGVQNKLDEVMNDE